MTNRSGLKAASPIETRCTTADGLEPVDVRRVERALHDARQHRRRHAVTGHVSDQQRGPSRGRGGVVVQVPAQRRTGRVSAADRHAVHDRFASRQQALLEGPRFGHLVFQPLQVLTMVLAPPAQLDAPFHERPEHLAIERFLDEVERGAADRPHQLLVEIVDAARHQDHVERRKACFQLRHQLEAVEIGHPDVDDRELGAETLGERQRLARQPRADDVMVLAQHALDRAEHARLVVHDEDARRPHDRCGCGSDTACGTSTRTSVPLPGTL